MARFDIWLIDEIEEGAIDWDAPLNREDGAQILSRAEVQQEVVPGPPFLVYRLKAQWRQYEAGTIAIFDGQEVVYIVR